MSTKHDCPLCSGTGKVTKQVAASKIVVRDRTKYNATMREVNKNARLRKKEVAT